MELSHELTTYILAKLPEQTQREIQRFQRSNYQIDDKLLTPELVKTLLAHPSFKGKYYLATYKALKTLERNRNTEQTLTEIGKSEDGAALQALLVMPVKKHSEAYILLNKIFKLTPRYWLYSSQSNEFYMPENASYTPGRQRSGSWEPPFTSWSRTHWERGSAVRNTTTLSERSWKALRDHYRKQQKEVTVGRLLKFMKLEVPTPELLENYDKELQRYLTIRNNLGEQYWLTGEASIPGSRSWYSSSSRNLSEGDLRVVIDDEEDFGKAPYTILDPYYKADPKATTNDEESTHPTCELPIHTELRMFDLTYHRMLQARSEDLTLYVYQPQLIDKLILPKPTIGLINLLMTAMASGEAGKQTDLVRGKSGGLIVLASGHPGTGKTLSAEVYSEVVQRPLYTVQCSQLGLDPEQLEKSLSEILRRALRYKAVLLIDEADVYIRERGDDLVHNAMVGVFLRLLEYFSGMLFMTTNRAMIVDDAIESRCIAHLKYTLPSIDDAVSIWDIMREHFKVNMPGGLVQSLANTYNLSGRSIKNVCRLAAFMQGDKQLTLETVNAILTIQNKLGGEEGLRPPVRRK